MTFVHGAETPMEFEYDHPQLFGCNGLDRPASKRSTPFYLSKSSLLTKPTKITSDSTVDCNQLERINLDDSLSPLTPKDSPPTLAVVPFLSTHSPIASTAHEQSLNLNENDVKDENDKAKEVLPDEDNDHPLPTSKQTPPAMSYSGHHIYPIFHHQQDPVSQQRGSLFLFSGLLQLGCNIALFTMAVYIGVQFAVALKHDVALKMDEYESDRLEEHFHCQQLYMQNRCDPTTRLPAVADLCRQWQKCLYRPAWIGKTKVLAETFAEIANGFVDTISLKTMFFTMTIILVSCWMSSLRTRQKRRQHEIDHRLAASGKPSGEPSHYVH